MAQYIFQLSIVQLPGFNLLITGPKYRGYVNLFFLHSVHQNEKKPIKYKTNCAFIMMFIYYCCVEKVANERSVMNEKRELGAMDGIPERKL